MKSIIQGIVSNWSTLNLLQSVKDKLLFYGLYSEIAAGKMSNKVGSDWLTVAGVAGSETFQCPNTAPYIAADTDYIWFKTNAVQRTSTTAELVGYDLQRTPVNYADNSPYAIKMIAILKVGETLTASERNNLFDWFDLPVLWDNVLNSYGHVKGNRIGQNLWTPEPVYSFYDTFTGTNGTLLSAHTADLGSITWFSLYDDKWKLLNGKAQCTTVADRSKVYFDSGKTNVDISVDLTIPNADYYEAGISLHNVTNTQLWCAEVYRSTAGTPSIRIWKGTSSTLIAEMPIAHEAATKTLRAVMVGNTISVYWGGVKIIDSLVTDGSYITNTKHGLMSYFTGSFSQVFFDNFIIV